MANPGNTTADPENRSLTPLWKTMALIDSTGYVPIDDIRRLPDGPRVEAGSRSWCDQLLAKAADPYRSSPAAARSVHFATQSTFDVLRHEHEVGDLRLVVRESVNVMFINAGGAGGARSATASGDPSDRVNDLAERVLNVRGSYVGPDFKAASYSWVFRPLPGVAASFSTAPGVTVGRMWSWAERVDCKILDDCICFLCFKIKEATSGRVVVLDSKHWFDGACWEPYE